MSEKEIIDQDQITSMLEKVNNRIDLDQVENIGIHSGLSGISLFKFYYAQKFTLQDIYDEGADLLENIFKKIDEGYTFPTFCSGIAGAAWTIQHLAEKDIIDLETTDVLENFDEYLYSFINAEMEQGRSDFLHSTLGVGLYFFRRYTFKNTSSFYEKSLNAILTFLEKTAIQKDQGITWYSRFEDKGGKNISNFSLAHGIISIGLFLIKLSTTPVFKDRSDVLLKQLLAYISANKFKPKDQSSSLYPTYILYNNDHTLDAIKKDSRLAWCYGDITIGLLFIRAHEQLNDPNYKKLAIEIFEHTLSRKSLEETSIGDSGFCHGTFGLAYLYKVVSRYDTNIKDALALQANYWLKKAFAMNTGTTQCEFLQWGGVSKTWEPQASVLEGYAGIGLILLGFLDNVDSSWDESFLLS